MFRGIDLCRSDLWRRLDLVMRVLSNILTLDALQVLSLFPGNPGVVNVHMDMADM
jgi:hypothetical protein